MSKFTVSTWRKIEQLQKLHLEYKSTFVAEDCIPEERLSSIDKEIRQLESEIIQDCGLAVSGPPCLYDHEFTYFVYYPYGKDHKFLFLLTDPKHKPNLLEQVKDLMAQKNKLADELMKMGLDFNPHFITEDKDDPIEKWDVQRIDLLVVYLKNAIVEQRKRILDNTQA